MLFIGLKAWPTWLVNPGTFWGLLHLEIVVDPLPAQPHLACNVGYVHLFGEEVMDLVIAFYTLLMVLLTFLFLTDAACLCAMGL